MSENNSISKPDLLSNERCDGWHFMTVVRGDSDNEVLSKVREFLDDSGYSDIPLPKTAERLWWDYLNPNSISNGKYIFHPIIISMSAYHVHAVDLSIYNENYPDHKELWKGIILTEE